MRAIKLSAVVLTAIVVGAASASAQAEVSRAVSGGGVMIPGWMGRIDAGEAKNGAVLENAKLTKEGNDMHVVTGPALVYWNPSNTASGNYMVSATFKEPQYMNLNSHPHPYGIMIAGNDLGTENQTYLYCAAYGSGNFIVRGMGPAPFQMNGRGAAAPSVNKAAAKGEAVSQAITMSVMGDKVECAINGAVVWSADKASLLGPGKLKSLDGTYGIRSGHNTEVMVSGLSVMKH
ncbi:MAG: hypothetical protein ABIY52_05420 [Gemmatimonadaceae bacterium]